MNVDDVFGELEETEGCFAALLIGHDEDDTTLRIQTALTRNRIVITVLIRRGYRAALETFVLNGEARAKTVRKLARRSGVSNGTFRTVVGSNPRDFAEPSTPRRNSSSFAGGVSAGAVNS